MAKKQDIHELIEELNREEKERAIQRLREYSPSEDAEEEDEMILPPDKPIVKWKKRAAVAAPIAVAACLGVLVFVCMMPTSKQMEYCDINDCTLETAPITLKEYVSEEEKNWLYLDWYESNDWNCESWVYRLESTGKIVCNWENFKDIDSDCIVYLYITDDETRLDILETNESTEKTEKISNTKINYTYTRKKAYAYFDYKEYHYYLRVDNSESEAYILSLVDELLP